MRYRNELVISLNAGQFCVIDTLQVKYPRTLTCYIQYVNPQVEPSTMAEFVSEPITPEAGAFDAGQISTGLASLPAAFTWRNERFEIVDCLDHVKLSSREGGQAQGESYLRKQRFTVRLNTGQIAVIDFHRQTKARSGSKAAKQRWFMYTIEDGPDG